MELGPIFRSLIRNRARFWLIALEVALTLAVIANCVAIILEQRDRITRPTGMDVDNLLIVRSEPFAPEFKDQDYLQASYRRDLELLRSLPGVRAATGIGQVPLSGGGSASSRRPAGTEQETIGMPYFSVDQGILEALGVELVAGRAFEPGDFPHSPEEATAMDGTRNVILTRDAAGELFPDGDAVGQRIESQHADSTNVVVGVIDRMHCSWPLSSMAERVMLYPAFLPDERRNSYVVRAEPGMLDELYTVTEERLLAAGAGRLVTVRSLAEIKRDTYGELYALNSLLGGVIVLLIAVTSLGIVGLTSFSVTQRTRQIGTRRALGATRLGILRYFLLENVMITGAGLALGAVLTYGLNWALSAYAGAPRLDWPLVAGGMLLLWLAGLGAALLPALRSTRVQPVVATRTV